MVSLIPLVVLVITLGVPLLLGVGLVLLLSRRGGLDFNVNLRAVYFYLASFATLWIAVISFIGLTEDVLELALQTYYTPPTVRIEGPPSTPEAEATPAPDAQPRPPRAQEITPPPPDRYTREQIAQKGAVVLIAFPMWIFHWHRARQMFQASQTSFLHRVYLYAVMIIGLVVILVTGGMLLSQVLEVLLGTVGWEIEREVRIFWKDVISGGFNLLASLAIWGYHWRLVEALPEEGS